MSTDVNPEHQSARLLERMANEQYEVFAQPGDLEWSDLTRDQRDNRMAAMRPVLRAVADDLNAKWEAAGDERYDGFAWMRTVIDHLRAEATDA